MVEPLRRTVVGGVVLALAVATTSAMPQVSAQEPAEEDAGDPAATVTSISIDAESIAGPSAVPLGDLPRSAFATSASGGSRTASTALSDVPLAAIELSSTPLEAIPLGAIPLGAIATEESAASDLLDQVLLSSIPIEGGWEAVLPPELAEEPLQTLTLGQVLADAFARAELASTPLGAIDLSGTPLAAIPLGAIALGPLPLEAITVPGPDDQDTRFCDLLASEGDREVCEGLGIDGTALELALAGVDVGSTLSALPLGAIDLEAVSTGATPLGAIPLGAIDLAASPLGAIPLAAIDWASTPLAAIPLEAIPLAAIATESSPLGAIPLAAIPLAAIAAESAPLGAIPLGAIDLADSPLGAIPLGAIPLGAIATDTSPLGAIPLGAIDLADSPLGAIPLGAIDLSASPLGAIPLAAIDVGTSPLGAISLQDVVWADSPLGEILVTDADMSLAGLTLDDLQGLDEIPLRDVNADAAVFDLAVGAVSWSSTLIGALGLEALDTPAGQALLVCGGTDPETGDEPACEATTIAEAVELEEIPADGSLGEVVAALVDGADAGPLGDLLAGQPPAIAVDTSAAGLLPLDDAPLPDDATTDDTGGDSTTEPEEPLDLATLLGTADLSNLTQTENVLNLLKRVADLRDPDDPFTLSGTIASLLGATTAVELEGVLREVLAAVDADALQSSLSGRLVADLVAVVATGTVLPGDLADLIEALDEGTTLTGLLHELVGGLEDPDGSAYRLPAGLLADLFGLLADGTAVQGTLGPLLASVDGEKHQLGGALADILATLAGDLPDGSVLQLLQSLVADAETGLQWGDVLLSLVPTSNWNWEGVDLRDPALRDALATTAGTATVTMEVTATQPVATGAALSLQLPTALTLLPGGTVTSPDGTTVDLPAPVVNGTRVTWTLSLAEGVHEVAVAVRAGTVSGEFTPIAWVEVGDVVQQPLARTTLVVTSASEAAAGGPVPLAPDTLAFGHIAGPGDVDTYAIDVADGQRLSVRLGNLPADFDVVLHRAGAVPRLRQEPVDLQLPIDEPLPTLSPSQVAVTADTRADVYVPDGARPHSVAAQRDRTDERIETGPLGAGTWHLTVSGYNGASSPLPYTLRARLTAGPDLGSCEPRFDETAASVAAGSTTQPALATATDTLFLVNRSRLTAMFGQEQATQVVDGIGDLAADAVTDVNGVDAQILFLDSDPGIQEAYAAWDARPCDPDLANDVVRAIGGLLDEATGALPLEHLVVVGSDEVVPFGRVQDATTLSNEQDHASAIAGHDAIRGSLAAGRVLTDDVYADAVPTGVGERELFAPEVAIGRLVETPDQIIASLQSYRAAGGLLPASRGFSSGYDFLTDGGQRVGAELVELLGSEAAVDELISDSWTADDLSRALVAAGKGQAPVEGAVLAEIAAVNAHFDQHRLLPALGDSTGDESDLLTTADLRASLDAADDVLAGRLLFSMGCHAGLSLAGIGVDDDDWAELFADAGALWVGNTGYGYGDTELVALTEDLMVRFADALNATGTVGGALAAAKNAYLRDLGVISAYDEKALMESTLYGLPFYRLELGAELPAPDAVEVVTPTPVSDSLARHSVSFDLANELVVEGDPQGDGGWYSVRGETTTVPFRPIQPRTSTPVTSGDDAWVATGALLTGLTSRDEVAFIPRYFRPTVDLSTTEPAQRFGDTAFPAGLQRITRSTARGGSLQQELVITPGQFRTGGAEDSGGQRVFETVDAEVLYAPTDTDDHRPPAIRAVDSTVVGAGGPSFATFTVDTRDAASAIHRVVVLYTEGASEGSATWTLMDLSQVGETTTWTGSRIVGDSSLDYFVQVVDTAGNVAVSTDKGRFFGALAVDPVRGPLASHVTVASTDDRQNGWFDELPVTFTLDDGNDLVFSVYEVTEDGASTWWPEGIPFEIDQEGLHRIRIERFGDPTQSIDLTLPIDTTPPGESTADVQPPPNGAGWNNEAATVTLTAGSDPGPIGSGTDVLQWDWSGATDLASGSTTERSMTFEPIAAEGRSTVDYLSVDRATNSEQERSLEVRLDTTPPDVDGPQATVSEANGLGWFHESPAISTTTTDPELDGGPDDPYIVSGIAGLRVVGTRATTLDLTASDVAPTGATVGIDAGVLSDGVTTLTATGTDIADNTWTEAEDVHVDTTEPNSTLAVAAEQNEARWYNDSLDGDRTPTITAVDAHPDQAPDEGRFPSGIGAIALESTGAAVLERDVRTASSSDADEWTDDATVRDDNTWQVSTGQPITDEGVTTLQWGARDRAGIVEGTGYVDVDTFALANEATVQLDMTPPTVTVNKVPFAPASLPDLVDRVETFLDAPAIESGSKQVFAGVPAPDSVVDPTAPPTYHLRQSVPVHVACSDATSTVASCVTDLIDPQGDEVAFPAAQEAVAHLDTSRPGIWEFRVTATDVAGNTHVFSYPYRVAFRLVDSERTCQLYRDDKAVNAGATALFRVAVCDVDGVAPENATVRLQAVTVDEDSGVVDAGDANSEGWFRWDERSGHHVFNLDTTNLSDGEHTLRLRIDADPATPPGGDATLLYDLPFAVRE